MKMRNGILGEDIRCGWQIEMMSEAQEQIGESLVGDRNRNWMNHEEQNGGRRIVVEIISRKK